MPKIIKNLKQDILQKSKELLENGDYESLTVKSVASSCGIAVGTVYNYFPSKENLVANIMLEGWQKSLDTIRKKTERSFSCSVSLKTIYGYLLDYSEIFKISGGETENEIRRILKKDLSELIYSALLYFGANMSPDPTCFLTDVLITEASKNAPFDEIEPFITRIVKL